MMGAAHRRFCDRAAKPWLTVGSGLRSLADRRLLDAHNSRPGRSRWSRFGFCGGDAPHQASVGEAAVVGADWSRGSAHRGGLLSTLVRIRGGRHSGGHSGRDPDCADATAGPRRRSGPHRQKIWNVAVDSGRLGTAIAMPVVGRVLFSGLSRGFWVLPTDRGDFVSLGDSVEPGTAPGSAVDARRPGGFCRRYGGPENGARSWRRPPWRGPLRWRSSHDCRLPGSIT